MFTAYQKSTKKKTSSVQSGHQTLISKMQLIVSFAISRARLVLKSYQQSFWHSIATMNMWDPKHFNLPWDGSFKYIFSRIYKECESENVMLLKILLFVKIMSSKVTGNPLLNAVYLIFCLHIVHHQILRKVTINGQSLISWCFCIHWPINFWVKSQKSK